MRVEELEVQKATKNCFERIRGKRDKIKIFGRIFGIQFKEKLPVSRGESSRCFSNKAEPASLLPSWSSFSRSFHWLLAIVPSSIQSAIFFPFPRTRSYLSDRPLFHGEGFFNRDFFNATNRYRLSRQFHGRGYALDQFLLGSLSCRSSVLLSPTGDKIFFLQIVREILFYR